MWLKENRFLLVSRIYQILFWRDYDSTIAESDINLFPTIEDLNYPENWNEFISEKILKLNKLNPEFEDFLTKMLHDPAKTSILVKAILSAAFVEREEIGEETFKELKIPSVYSKLTQDLVGGQSPELVYSILK